MIYVRPGVREDLPAAERQAMTEHLRVIETLEEMHAGDQVIARLSLLPFPDLLDEACQARGSTLLGGGDAYRYVADMRRWAADLDGLTPRTWFDCLPDRPGAYVVKGAINSLKHRWDSHCFAADLDALTGVVSRVRADPLLGTQTLCVRQYVALRTLAVVESGLPISEEYRFFVWRGQVAAAGAYWSSHPACAGLDPAVVSSSFLDQVIGRLPAHVADWVVIDVARSAAGGWIVIELNDANHSGLCGADPQQLYGALASR